MVKVYRDDLPAEGVQIVDVGHFKPGQHVEVADEVAIILEKKGFKVIKEKSRKEKEG